MSSGAFDNLLSLSENLAKKGNEAETLRRSPEYCLLALRGWLEYLLQFLERQHGIPTALKDDYVGQGENEYRINRLTAHGVNISNIEVDLLHDIRKDSNKAAHPADNEHFFTSTNSERNLRKALLIRDWLYREYVVQSNIGNSGTSTDPSQSYQDTHQSAAANAWPKSSLGITNTATTFSSDPSRSTRGGKRAPRPSQIMILASLLMVIAVILISKQQQSSMPEGQLSLPTNPPVASTLRRPPAPLRQIEYNGIQSTTLRYENLLVTVDGERSADGAGRIAVVTGRFEDRIVFILRADKATPSNVPSAKVELRRLNLSTGVPQVVLIYFSGGAHCCTLTTIATRDPSGKWQTVDGGAIDGDLGYEFIDLDNSGGSLLVSYDNSFLYAFACYACSFAPTRIKRLVGSELTDVTQNPKYLPFLREQLQRMETTGRSNGVLHSNGYLGGWVAAKALVGELEDAWHAMLISYERNSDWPMEECLTGAPLNKCPANSKRQLAFPDALAKHLVSTGYVTAEQAWRLLRVSLPSSPPVAAVPRGDSSKLSQSEIDAFRRRVSQCWIPPAGVDATTKIYVVLRVLLTPNGSMASEPVLVEATASALGPALAESAKRALQLCQPFTMLKPEHYDQWKDLQLKFDPHELLGG